MNLLHRFPRTMGQTACRDKGLGSQSLWRLYQNKALPFFGFMLILAAGNIVAPPISTSLAYRRF